MNQPLHATNPEPGAVPAEQESARVGRSGAGMPELRATSQVRAKRLGCLAAERDHALLASLAEHADLRAFERDVLEVEPCELADPQPASVQELQQRRIAQAL